MGDEQPSTGGFSHARQPRRDGFHDTLHPETGERLLLTRVEASDSKSSVNEWSQTFALQEALGDVQPTAWWPVERQGAEGDVAFAAFTPWKSTLSHDLAKGYRCNPAELKALAECLVDGLNQLHGTAQRPHGALRPDCIVFPKSSGDGHDSLAPRLTGLLPLDETDPRDHGDRRRAGHLLYAAITGADTNFRGVPDFGLAWSDVSLPGKNGWKKFIEDLTSGNLDSESYEQIRLRIGKSQGGKLPIVPIVVGLIVVGLGVGGFLKFKGGGGGGSGGTGGSTGGGGGTSNLNNGGGIVSSNRPTTNVVDVKVPAETNPVVQTGTDSGSGDPGWLVELKKDSELLKLLNPATPVRKRTVETALSKWWNEVPSNNPALWLPVSFKLNPIPAVGEGLIEAIRTEVGRRAAYETQAKGLATAQAKLITDIKTWVGGLGWGQSKVESLIESEVTLSAKEVLQKGPKLDFDSTPDAASRYGQAFQQVTNATQYSPASFVGWSGLNPTEKAQAADYLVTKWNRNLKNWAEFKPATLIGPEAGISAEITKARNESLDTAELDGILATATNSVANINRELRLRRFLNEAEAKKALNQQTGSLLADATTALETVRRNKGNALKQLRLKELRDLDAQLAGKAVPNIEANRPRAVRDALVNLQQELKKAKQKATDYLLSPTEFIFKKSEDRIKEFADPVLVEEVNEMVGPKGTNQLDQAIQKLAAVENRQEFPKAKALKGQLDQKQKDLKDAEVIRANQLAKQRDSDWAEAAETTAADDVVKALTGLEANLKGSSATVTNKSASVRTNLIAVRDWLARVPVEFQVDRTDWLPPSSKPVIARDWAKYKQVKDKDDAFERTKRDWANADQDVSGMGKFDQAKQFRDLDVKLKGASLGNKAYFDKAREQLGQVLPAVEKGEALGGRSIPTEASGLSSYIGSLEEYFRDPRPSNPYFESLDTKLQARFVTAKQNKKALDAKEGEMKRLTDLKAQFVQAAEGVGKVALFGKGKTPTVTGVRRSNALKWKALLETSGKDLVDLSVRLESADKSRLETELKALGKAIEDALVFTQ